MEGRIQQFSSSDTYLAKDSRISLSDVAAEPTVDPAIEYFASKSQHDEDVINNERKFGKIVKKPRYVMWKGKYAKNSHHCSKHLHRRQ